MVLLMVMLLVILFTGLGLLAMRHTQGELRSAASYMDSTQATEAAEAAVMMAATDMKLNWEDNHTGDDYKFHLCDAPLAGGPTTGISSVTFSDRYTGGDVDAGAMPDDELAGRVYLGVNGVIKTNFASVTLTYDAAENAPAPPGFSNDLDDQTFGWFYVNTTSTATYGPDPSEYPNAPRGRAQVTSYMKIGPVRCI
jgi:hypothetical protein